MLPGIARADEKEPGAPFGAIREALAPLASTAEQAAAATAALNQVLVQAMLDAGARSESLAPVIAEAASALATLKIAAEESLLAGAPALDQLGAFGETVAGEIAVATNTLDAALRERAETLASAYGSLGPALTALCQANDQAPLLLSLLPYGFAVGGAFAPLGTACADVPPRAAPPTEQLAPLLAQYAAVMDGTGFALEPLAGLVQPLFEPACTAFVLIQTASIFVTLPVETGSFVDPALSAACRLGQGANPASPALVFVTVASQPFVPLAEDLAGSMSVLVPVVDPLRPVTGPATAGACATLPASGQLGPLLPVPVPVEPTVFIGATSVLLCAAADLLPLDDVPVPGAGSQIPREPGVPILPGSLEPPAAPTFDAPVPDSGAPGVLVAPPGVTRVSTAIGGLSPRLWAPLIPLALVVAGLIGWMRWNRALVRLQDGLR